MTRIEIDAEALIVHVQGLDQLWAFKSELRVPLAHVSGVVRAEDEAREWWHGIRAPGTHLPGVITAGTFYVREGRVFWDVHAPEGAIAIGLRDDRYAKLVIEVEDPTSEVRRIETVLASRKSPAIASFGFASLRSARVTRLFGGRQSAFWCNAWHHKLAAIRAGDYDNVAQVVDATN